MPQHRKTVRGSQPDGEDVRAALDASWKDFGIAVEVHIYTDLLGELIVEAVGSGYTHDGVKVHETYWERWVPHAYTVDVLMMRATHQVYHKIGKATLPREVAKAQQK